MSKPFADFGVPPDLVETLGAGGITDAFAIQEATLSDALSGRDVCGKAPTGSGKTLAFSVPLVAAVKRARPKSPRGLVLVPTRELAAQVLEVIEPLANTRGLRVTSIYGGVGFEPQLKAIRRGVDIVVACPGRLNDLINRNALSLSDVDFVVIDEADRMADMGFLPEVKRLLDQTRSDRQTLLFSATLDGDVDVLIKRYQKDPARHAIHRDEDEEDNTLHLFWKSPRPNRVSLVAEILKRVGPTIIFTRTKHGADRLSQQLEREGLKASAIHGGRTQPQRDKALALFVNGRVQALVATDVAARGIHVDGVHCVIHFDAPDDHKGYVHRSGRTARAGATGTVITLVEPEKTRMVTQMQRQLLMPAGVIDPNFRALPDEVPPFRPVITHDESPNDGGKGSSDKPPREGVSNKKRRPRNRRSSSSTTPRSSQQNQASAQRNTGPRKPRAGRRRPAA